MSVFFFFALATVVGSLSTLFWIPEDDLGRGYFQMNALIVLGLLALVWAVVLLAPLEPFGTDVTAGRLLLALGFGGSFLYYAAIWKERWRASRWAAALALAGCVGALVVASRQLISTATPLPFREPLAIAGLLTSALLLGWSLIAMLLGHWYLVAPRLTFRHLVVFCWVLLGTVVLRLAALGGTLAAAVSVDRAGRAQSLARPHQLRRAGDVLLVPPAWGLVIPLALAVMSLHCARQRSNQSATGILYVLVVGTFIGEITAYYLAVTTGIPA